MSVEIWKGVCSGLKQETYDTEVEGFRDRGMVCITQAGDSYGNDVIWMDEAQAIDIALCILKELAPGFFEHVKEY